MGIILETSGLREVDYYNPRPPGGHGLEEVLKLSSSNSVWTADQNKTVNSTFPGPNWK